MQWRAVSDSLVSRPCADDWLCYNPVTGATHLLNLVDREVVGLFGDRPLLTQGEITRSLASRLEIDVDAALEDYVATLLPQLEQVGLIESVPQ